MTSVSTDWRILTPSPDFLEQQALPCRSNRKIQLRQGCRGERMLWGYDEGILCLWSDEEGRSLCPAWFRLCWRAHWRLFEEASFGEEGKKSHGLIFYFWMPPSHLYQISRSLKIRRASQVSSEPGGLTIPKYAGSEKNACVFLVSRSKQYTRAQQHRWSSPAT